MTLAGVPIDACTASARLDGDGLSGLDVRAEAEGTNLRALGVRVPFTGDVLAGLSGQVLLDLRRPDAARRLAAIDPRWLPDDGWLGGSVAAGTARIDDGRLRGAGLAVDVLGGTLALTPSAQPSADGDAVTVRARLVDADRLPLPEDAPLRPVRGTAEVTVRLGARREIDARIDVGLRDGDAHDVDVAGSLLVELGDEITFTPDLRIRDARFGAAAEELRAGGSAVLAGSELRVPSLRLRSEPGGGECTLQGRVDLGADTPRCSQPPKST